PLYHLDPFHPALHNSPRLTLLLIFYSHGATRDLHFSLHDALPIFRTSKAWWWCAEGPRDSPRRWRRGGIVSSPTSLCPPGGRTGDRKSRRLNSSHVAISYGVLCLKKKKRAPVCRQHRAEGKARIDR